MQVSALSQLSACLYDFIDCLLQSELTFAEIQHKCGLANSSLAEALCVDCMQAALLFGKIDQ